MANALFDRVSEENSDLQKKVNEVYSLINQRNQELENLGSQIQIPYPFEYLVEGALKNHHSPNEIVKKLEEEARSHGKGKTMMRYWQCQKQTQQPPSTNYAIT